jgi:hypothetical protein
MFHALIGKPLHQFEGLPFKLTKKACNVLLTMNPYKDYSKDINMITHLTTEVSSPRHHNIISDEQYNIKALITRPFKF